MRHARLLALMGVIALSCGRDGSNPPPDRERGAIAPASPKGSPAESPTLGAASPVATTTSPSVALLVSRPGQAETAWVSQPLHASAPAPAVARLRHLPEASVRGALLPAGNGLVVVADMERAGDGSFGAWLVRLDAKAPAQKLADRCVHASRPLVLEDGRVLVERGSAGPDVDASEAAQGQLRTDSLQVDVVDPSTGAARTLHSWTGYAAHLAGSLGDEVLLYRVAFGHADIVAVHLETGALSVLATAIPPFARDFSVDSAARRLIYTNRDESGWLVETLDLDSRQRSALERSAGMWAAPHAWPRGGVLLNDGRGGSVRGSWGLSRPLGDGFDVLASTSKDGRFAALTHRSPGALPVPFVVDLDSDTLHVIALESGARAEIAGVTP